MFHQLIAENLAPANRRLSERLSNLTTSLDEVGKLNYDTGILELDEVALERTIAEFFEGEHTRHYAEDLKKLAKDGFAIIPPSVNEEQGAALPWQLLNRPNPTELILPSTLAMFGVGPTSTLESARDRMSERFPNVPGYIISNAVLEGLIQSSRTSVLSMSFENIIHSMTQFDANTKITIKPELAIPPPVQNPALEAVVCIINAEWTIHWWGWSICFNQACGEKVAAALSSVGGAAAVANLFRQVVLTSLKEALQAAIKAAGGLLSFALLILSLYISLMLQWNNTPRGVCLQGNWPTPWIGMAVWATGR